MSIKKALRNVFLTVLNKFVLFTSKNNKTRRYVGKLTKEQWADRRRGLEELKELLKKQPDIRNIQREIFWTPDEFSFNKEINKLQ